MAKRIILISSFPLFVAIAIIAIVPAVTVRGQIAENGNLDDANVELSLAIKLL
jgi:hypothetical protein